MVTKGWSAQSSSLGPPCSRVEMFAWPVKLTCEISYLVIVSHCLSNLQIPNDTSLQ